MRTIDADLLCNTLAACKEKFGKSKHLAWDTAIKLVCMCPTIETARILPPFGKTKVFWIRENRLDTVANVLLPSPGIIEEEIDITMWGYDKDGNLFAVIDNDPITVGTQYLYLSLEDAQNALATGSWKEKQHEKQ